MVSVRQRHGRSPRSSVRGIAAPNTGGRGALFTDVSRDVINYLCDTQPELMKGVRVDMALLPSGALADGVPRQWLIQRAERRVILFRLPIEKGIKLHRDDDWHRRNNIESCVIEAVADLLGMEPYDLAPNRYFPHS